MAKILIVLVDISVRFFSEDGNGCKKEESGRNSLK